MIVLYLCAQLAVLYTYNCLLILIYYSLGQNLLIINKYAVRSRYSLFMAYKISKGLAYIITLYTITSLVRSLVINTNCIGHELYGERTAYLFILL